jgi:hypothetical protein
VKRLLEFSLVVTKDIPWLVGVLIAFLSVSVMGNAAYGPPLYIPSDWHWIMV